MTIEEKEKISFFFDELLFREGGAYTLLGSKPITRLVIEKFTEEELLSIQEKKNWLIKREVRKATNYVKHLKESADEWLEFQKKLNLKGFRIFKDTTIEGFPAEHICFVNILNTALVLQKHYDSFLKVVGEGFDPFEMACEVDNLESTFWRKVWKHPALIGILFGYGEVNSWAFYWKHWGHDEGKHQDAESIVGKVCNMQRKRQVNQNEFPLPTFVSFENGTDEVIERYKKEREEIQKFFAGTDFLSKTIEVLTSS